jgi:hypothetical protein
MLKRDTIHLALVSLLALLIVACSPAATATASSPEATEFQTGPNSTIVAQTGTSGTVGAAIPGLTGNERILAWIAPAQRPGGQGASQAGELVFFNPDGSTETILDLPDGTTRVTSCGSNAESSSGAYAFVVTATTGGEEKGTVYLMQGASSELKTVASDLNPASCVGSAPFQFSPDGSRFAFLDWPLGATNMVSPYGILRIFNTADASQVASFENVTEFKLTDTGALFVNFFPNDDGEATEVAVTTWDGTVDTEVTSLVAEEENRCYYTSSSIAQVASGLISIMGYRCDRGDNTNTQWQLYLIDPNNRTAQLAVGENAAGRFFVFSDTNAIFAAPDGNSILFALPDGINNQSVSLYSSPVSSISPTVVLDRSGIMPAVSDLPYDANNAVAQVSPNGRYLAMVVNTPDNSANLHVYDLSDTSTQPIVIDAGDPGDTVASMVFSAASDRLYYVAGTDQGGNNSLFALDLTTGAESRIRRGRYAQIVLSPDGTTLAAMNWVEFDPEEDRYLTLEVVDVASTVPTVIYIGGEVGEDGKLANASFAYPLSWRDSGDSAE